MDNKNKKINYRGLKVMPFIIGNEAFEKLGTMGTSSNLLIYFITVFNMRSIRATNIVNIFNGSANFGTLIGAFLCDTYFGRFKTLAFASIASFLGMLMLTLTATTPKLHPPHCAPNEASNCQGPKATQLSFLIGGLALLVIGASGIRPCSLAFGADQFNPATESGKRAINSYFNWYYFTVNFAIMISVTFIVYVQSSVSWVIGLAIPTSFMLVSCVLFLFGTKMYVKVEPKGSPLFSLLQVIVASVRKRHLKLVEDESLVLFDHVLDESINEKLGRTDQFRFLDKAAIITNKDQINPKSTSIDPWKLCSIQQVEQVKCLVRVFPIWILGIIYMTAPMTMNNYVIFQALQSNRQLGTKGFKIPAASYSIFTLLTITLWIPFYDKIIVPSLRKLTGKTTGITILQKMGIGFVLMILALIINGLVEKTRRDFALNRPTLGIEPHRGDISSLSGFWLVPALIVTGLSEAFGVIALNEFYYNEFPTNMRSIGGAFFYCGMAMSSYLTSFLQAIVVKITSHGSNRVSWLVEDLNKGRLDLFYYLIACLELVNFLFFLVCAKWYRYSGCGDISSYVTTTTTSPVKSTYVKSDGNIEGTDSHIEV